MLMRNIEDVTDGEPGSYAEGYSIRMTSSHLISSHRAGDVMVHHYQVDTPDDVMLEVRVCVANGWEHAAITGGVYNNMPNWDEMNAVKQLLWTDDECVVQYHPPAKDYVNEHPGMLHLWRPVDGVMRQPPKDMV